MRWRCVGDLLVGPDEMLDLFSLCCEIKDVRSMICGGATRSPCSFYARTPKRSVSQSTRGGTIS